MLLCEMLAFCVMSVFLSCAFAQTKGFTTWQVTRVFNTPDCSMVVGSAANTYAQAPCDPAKPPTPCKWAFGSSFEVQSCETKPDMWGIFGLQFWQGSKIACDKNVVVGSDLVMTAEFTFSALFNNCQNLTEHGPESSVLYACDSNHTTLVSSKYATSDCSGAPVSQQTGPVGCSSQGPKNVMVVSPQFCDWFHKQRNQPYAAVQSHLRQHEFMPILI